MRFSAINQWYYVERTKEGKDLEVFIILIVISYQFDKAMKKAKDWYIYQKWRSINATTLSINEISSLLLCTLRDMSSGKMNVS